MTTQSLEYGRIAVVSGGRSTERERSLMSGRTALESLDRQGYTTVFLDAADKEFADEIRGADVAFLAIAGQYAEDGKLQGLLESLNIPYTGSGVTASAIGMHKTLAKTLAAAGEVAVTVPAATAVAAWGSVGDGDEVDGVVADAVVDGVVAATDLTVAVVAGVLDVALSVDALGGAVAPSWADADSAS